MTSGQHRWLSLSRGCSNLRHPLAIALLYTREPEERERLVRELRDCPACGTHRELESYLNGVLR